MYDVYNIVLRTLYAVLMLIHPAAVTVTATQASVQYTKIVKPGHVPIASFFVSCGNAAAHTVRIPVRII
jgi:hypothetical protein